MICSARARVTYSQGSVSYDAKPQRSSTLKIDALAKARIRPPCRGFAIQTDPAEWQELAAKRQSNTYPRWIAKQVVPSKEIQRTLIRHSSGNEYEIGIWAMGNTQNLQPALSVCEEIKGKLLPNLQQAWRLQRMPISIPAIKAAMVMGGRLPLLKILHHSLCESFEFHACVSSQPKEEGKEVYQLFEQQVERKVEQIKDSIQHQEKEEESYFDRHGYSKEAGWNAMQMLNQQNRQLAIPSGMMSVKETDAQITAPAAFILPDSVKKAVKIHQTIFKHYAGSLYEVGVWAYPQKDALETIKELLNEGSPLKNVLDEIKKNLAKDLSTALELQHKPYSYPSFAAASQVAGRSPLSQKVCRLHDGEVKVEAFVSHQPAKEVEEVQQAFDRQVKEAVRPTSSLKLSYKLRPELFIRYKPDLMFGSPPENPLSNMIAWSQRLTETERILESAEEGSLSAKQHLEWLTDWESGNPQRPK